MESVIVRPLREDDIPLIVEWMLRDALWQRYQMTETGITADFTGALERGDILLTADADLPARGFAWCLLNGMFGTHAYLKRIGVDPAFAGRGIGGLMLERVEAEVRALGRDSLFLLVSDFNDAAQRFYRRHGYEQIASFPGLALPGVAEVLFCKAL
jgi:ribosomal protein S18 acetylase RimI-like enzyme